MEGHENLAENKLTQQVAPSAHIGAGASGNGLAVAAVQIPEGQVSTGTRVAEGSASGQGSPMGAAQA